MLEQRTERGHEQHLETGRGMERCRWQSGGSGSKGSVSVKPSFPQRHLDIHADVDFSVQ